MLRSLCSQGGVDDIEWLLEIFSLGTFVEQVCSEMLRDPPNSEAAAFEKIQEYIACNGHV